MTLSFYDEESKLLRALQQDDVNAFNQIYDQYGKLIAHKLKRFVLIPEVVEELHQDIFMNLWMQRHNISEIKSIKAYLFGIMRNKVVDFFRAAAKDTQLKEALVLHVDVAYNHVEAELLIKENQALLEQIITQLPLQRQKVFRFIKIEGRSYQEAAECFSVSVSTIKDHMAKATVFVKQQLAHNYPQLILLFLMKSFFK